MEGDEDGALAALSAADERVGATDDRLAKAVVLLARARVLDALGSASADDVLVEARAALIELGVTGDGWDALFRLATGAGATTA
jgi:hypothetical protein